MGTGVMAASGARDSAAGSHFSRKNFVKEEICGSPIIDMSGKAIGIVSVDLRSPVLVDSLSTGLLRSIRTCLPSLKYRRVSRLLDEAKQT